MRHARHQPHDDHQTGRDGQGLGRIEHLPIDQLAHVLGARGAGNHDRSGGGQQQRWQLRHQTVTDGQQGIDLAGIGEGHVVLQHTDEHAADEVDEQNQQTGNGVAAHELAGTVHGTVELGLLGDLGTAGLGLDLVDQAGVEVGIDGHLLAGHGVEGEACAHLGNAPGALGNHHEVDDHEDGEHYRTDDVVAADHHFTEGLDHLARSAVAFLAVKHDHAGGSDVERQAQQGRHQQNGREGSEIQRTQGIHADQQDHDRQGDVEGEEHVEQERRDRQHHHCQHHQQEQRHTEIAPTETGQVVTGTAD